MELDGEAEDSLFRLQEPLQRYPVAVFPSRSLLQRARQEYNSHLSVPSIQIVWRRCGNCHILYLETNQGWGRVSNEGGVCVQLVTCWASTNKTSFEDRIPPRRV